eukprot:Pgem_evm1s12113
MMFLLLPALLMQIELANARPGYPSKIPNGNGFPNHVKLGHVDDKKVANNQFGKDFAAAGYKWTKTFCEKDSDGDKISNGAELGDPDCKWNEGDPNPNPAQGITDPSIANPGSHPSPSEQSDAITTEERGQRDCLNEIQYPGHFYKNVSLTKNFAIPAQETTYIFRYMNLTEFLGSTEPHYVTSGEAIIDNIGYHHHAIVHACPKGHKVEKLVGWEIERAFINEGCYTLSGFQTGQQKMCEANGQGSVIAPEYYSVLVLETHYNNPKKEEHLIDNSALQLGLVPAKNAPKDFKIGSGIAALSSLTPNATIYEQFVAKNTDKWTNGTSGLSLLGKEFNRDYYYDGTAFTVPANTDYFEHVFSYNIAEEVRHLIPEEGLEIFQSFVHGHGKLQKAWTTLTRTNHTNDKTMIACYDDYEYLEPYQFVFPQNDTKSQRIYKDTVLTQHCVYKSHDEPIYNGFATNNEMCNYFGNIYIPDNLKGMIYFKIMKQDQAGVQKELRDGMGGFFNNYLKPNQYALDKDMVCNADKEKELRSAFSIVKSQQIPTRESGVKANVTPKPTLAKTLAKTPKPPTHTPNDSTTTVLAGSLCLFSMYFSFY